MQCVVVVKGHGYVCDHELMCVYLWFYPTRLTALASLV